MGREPLDKGTYRSGQSTSRFGPEPGRPSHPLIARPGGLLHPSTDRRLGGRSWLWSASARGDSHFGRVRHCKTMRTSQNRFSASWARAVARAGLPRGTRFQDLRHTFASALIAYGCSVKAVQLALGHENASVTLNNYAHLWPSDDERTRDAIEAFMRSEFGELGSFWVLPRSPREKVTGQRPEDLRCRNRA